ncbi:unnamed protein product [Aureobasidium pullulans]|nr:unnamed protein product [Aureobasidium pullulans]
MTVPGSQIVSYGSKKLRPEDYQVCWICPLPIERTAAEAMLDERHAPLPNNVNDSNIYTLGRIGPHNVAITSLPAGNSVATAIAATHMKYAFPAMRVVLLVGIGGGAPSLSKDIRLGDIVISYPDGTYGGVIQVDYGKSVPTNTHEDGFEFKGALNQPPDQLLNVVNALQAKHSGLGESDEPEYFKFLEQAIKRFPRINAVYPGADSDRLFHFLHDHILDRPTCDDCDNSETINRPSRLNTEPKIHLGLIASANNVRKDGRTRESLRKKLNVLCFEMEAAGIMNNFPCLVIRGISDYADSHKNDQWQPFAALAAAPCAKEGLLTLPETTITCSKTLGEHEQGLSIVQDLLLMPASTHPCILTYQILRLTQNNTEQMNTIPYLDYVLGQLYAILRTASECLKRISRRPDVLTDTTKTVTTTTALPTIAIDLGTGSIDIGSGMWEVVREQHTARISGDTASHAEELKVQLTGMHFWSSKADETILVHRYLSRPLLVNDRHTYEARLTAIETQNKELKATISKLERELERVDARARLEARVQAEEAQGRKTPSIWRRIKSIWEQGIRAMQDPSPISLDIQNEVQ